ncbi:MAG: ATP-dependent protease, Lon family [Peptococcaceae bacterium]|jgi:ATP-dependent Lon protease|nr:ATP-dependent protease, Lon family [Peptococcaceae bacterium]
MSVLDKKDAERQLIADVEALYALVIDLWGADHLVLKGAKLGIMDLINSSDLGERILGLEKLVFQNPTLDKVPGPKEIPGVMEHIKEEISSQMARRITEDQIERMINEKIADRQDEYIQDMKRQVLAEQGGVENAATQEKLNKLEKMEMVSLGRSAMEKLRPETIEEVVGQSQGVKSLLAKIISPFPQHVILYGPPGVGKTTTARLALARAKEMGTSVFGPEAPFIEVDGNTLRWDPRDITNPLIGSVHDPIYQGAKRDLADSGVPEPKLGLVSEANGGILFIDEIGEMDDLLLNKLLKVLEDKRVFFESSYYDPEDPAVPAYIKQIFDTGVPADFILIGATTRSPGEINPAIRSRCAEVFFSPLTPEDIKEILAASVKKLQVQCEPEVLEIISQFTIEGRKANNLLADAYSRALLRQAGPASQDLTITVADVREAIQSARLTPYVSPKNREGGKVGSIAGLGVAGFLGSLIEIEAVAFPIKQETEGNQAERKAMLSGKIRFNETAGSMAKDSVFNASSVFRLMTGEDLSKYDVHINVVGGGNIDGPSAGVAFTLAIYSAVTGKRLRQDVAVTGEISLQGDVKPVGGIPEKLYGAMQAGMKTVLIPKENEKDVPADLQGIQVVPVETIWQAMEYAISVE